MHVVAYKLEFASRHNCLLPCDMQLFVLYNHTQNTKSQTPTQSTMLVYNKSGLAP